MKDATKDAMANPIGTVTTGSEDPRPAVKIGERHDGLRVNLPYTDLREWLDEVDKLGEVRAISGASWQEEIGMAAELALHSDAAPCLVFDDVPGSPKGFRVLSIPTASRVRTCTTTRRPTTPGSPLPCCARPPSATAPRWPTTDRPGRHCRLRGCFRARWRSGRPAPLALCRPRKGDRGPPARTRAGIQPRSVLESARGTWPGKRPLRRCPTRFRMPHRSRVA